MTLSLPLRNPVTFEPAGKVTNVFFDDKSQQVLLICRRRR